MYRNILNKDFIEDFPYAKDSAQRIGYVLMKNPDKVEVELEKVKEKLNDEDQQTLAEQKQLITQANDGAGIANLFRKAWNPLACRDLFQKAEDHEGEVVPFLLKRLCATAQDAFIDTVTRFFSITKTNYSEELLNIYQDVRDEYARSMICIVLGLRGNEDIIPKIHDEFWRMVGNETINEEEPLSEGPLIALHELYHRFYEKRKKKK